MREEFKKYIQENKERLSDLEIKRLTNNFEEYYEDCYETSVSSFLYDFLCDYYKCEHEYSIFARNIQKNFPQISNILDVGAGTMCHLADALCQKGYNVSAIDPNIKLSEEELKRYKFLAIKNKFICDYSAGEGKGTDISKYNLLVGLRPCEATEHIIRQSLEYDKEFKIILCHCPAPNLEDGNKYVLSDDWFKYLSKISNKFDIQKVQNRYIASNSNKGFEYEKIPEL